MATPLSDEGIRTPSDWELASEDEAQEVEDVQSVSMVPESQRAAKPKERRLRLCNEVKPLAIRRAKEFARDVTHFLVQHYGCRKSSVRISREEVKSLWHGWCVLWQEKRGKLQKKGSEPSTPDGAPKSGE